MLILSTLFDKLCRVSGPNFPLTNGLGNYTASADNCTSTDSKVARNNGSAADKGVLTNGYVALDKVDIAQIGVACIKAVGKYADSCGNVGIVLNGDIARVDRVKLNIASNEVLISNKIYSSPTNKVFTPCSGHRNS
jgi:hypothetical protein